MNDERRDAPPVHRSSFIVHRSLLVFRLSALGDVIHTLPAVAMLRDALPETKISWVVEAPYRELVEVVGGVGAIPVRYKKWGKSLLASRGDIGAAVKAMRGFDASVDFQGLVKSAILGVIAGAKRRYGFDKEAIREKAALVFINEPVPVDTSLHVIEQNLELAAGVMGRMGPMGRLDWKPFLQRVEGTEGHVVLIPGAGKPNKIWPVERFREVATRLGSRALTVWGPGERELADAIGGRIAPPTNLRELAYILRHAEAVIGADTGPLHLAAALGTKAIGLFGPTNPRRNGPYGQLQRCVDRFSSTKCMESITVEEVMMTLDRVVAE